MAKKKEKEEEDINSLLQRELAENGLAELVQMAEDAPDMSVKCVSTGFPQLDNILHTSLNGLPLERDVEIFSKETEVGKTSIVLNFVEAFQKQGLRTLIIDAERTLTPEYLNNMGIVTKSADNPEVAATRLMRPDDIASAEATLNVVRACSNIFDLIVVDSIGALCLAGDLAKLADDDSKVAGISKLLSDHFKKTVKKRACVVWVNQTRSYIGYNSTGQQKFVTMGGRALPFWGSIRLDLSIVERLKGSDEEFYGFKTAFYTNKNKLSPPWRTAILTYIFGEGFSRTYDYFELAKRKRIITKNGAWLQFGDIKAQGDLNFYKRMKAEPALFDDIKHAVNEEEPELKEKTDEPTAA
jgi:recombination protein RecA